MKTAAFVALLAVSSLAAAAQNPSSTGIGVRIGYGWSSEFPDKNGDSISLRGPELAVSFPLGNDKGFRFAFEPSFFGGGRLSKGGDNDGDIYRFTVTASRNFMSSKFYLKAGVGFSHATDRANNINTESGVVGQFGGGVPLRGFLQRYAPTVELNYFAAGTGQLRGVFLGITGSL